MFTPPRITRSIAIAFGALAAATCAYVPAASAMPADPLTPVTIQAAGGPTQAPFSGSDASQIEAPAAPDRSDAAQRSPVEAPAVVGGRTIGVQHGPQVTTDRDIKWTVAALLALLVLLASVAALTTRPRRSTATS